MCGMRREITKKKRAKERRETRRDIYKASHCPLYFASCKSKGSLNFQSVLQVRAPFLRTRNWFLLSKPRLGREWTGWSIGQSRWLPDSGPCREEDGGPVDQWLLAYYLGLGASRLGMRGGHTPGFMIRGYPSTHSDYTALRIDNSGDKSQAPGKALS
jgi:hypothetical protein